MIKAILACDEAGGIGLNGSLPWPNCPRDFKWFKECTTGHVVVMGSTTWDDPHMPSPMPKRINYVLSRSSRKFEGAEGVLSGDTSSVINEIAKKHPDLITWVIGGANIIEQCWAIIDEFYLSRMPGTYNCDTRLKIENLDSFFLVHEDKYPEVTFQIYKQIRTRFP